MGFDEYKRVMRHGGIRAMPLFEGSTLRFIPSTRRRRFKVRPPASRAHRNPSKSSKKVAKAFYVCTRSCMRTGATRTL